MRAWWSGVALGMVLAAAGVGAAQPVFVQQQRIDAPTDALDFGRAVAVDGSTVAIGAPQETVNGVVNAGAVYIYSKTGNTWVLQQRLIAPLATGGFGYALDLSGDFIAVGDRPAQGTARGAVRVYQRAASTWTFHSIVQADPAGTAGAFDAFGQALVLNGTRLIVGAPSYRPTGGDPTGAAFVYDRTGTTWSASRLPTGPLVRAGSLFGVSVDVDGDVACVGLPGGFGTMTANNGGMAFYRRVNGAWTFQQGVDGLAGNNLGTACDVSGNLAAVGRGQGAGGVRQFSRVTGPTSDTWSVVDDVTDMVGPARSVSLLGSVLFIGGDRVTVWDASAPTGWTRRQTIDVAGRMKTDGSTLLAANTAAAWIYVLGTAPSGPPGAPTNVQGSVSGNTLSVTWGAPATGAAPTAYTLVARLVAGGAIVAEVPRGTATSFTTPAPNGTFVLSVRAANGSGTGPESTGVTVTIPQTAPPPGPPSNLAATVSGATVSFGWTPPASGGAVGAYVLVAGLAPGFVVPFAAVPLGATPGFAVPGVPPGTYYVRVLAQNAGGTSAPSNEVAFTVAGLTPPGAPTLNAPMVSGSTVSLSWGPGSGDAPTGYTLTASLAPGSAPIVTVPFTSTGASFPGVPSGTYYLRLTASNAAGTSAPSAEVAVVVP